MGMRRAPPRAAALRPFLSTRAPACLTQRVHERCPQVLGDLPGVVGGVRGLPQLENAIDDANLRGRGVQADEGRPVVHDHARPKHVATPVDRAGHERHLQERAELLQVVHARARVHEAALVREHGVRAHERVVRDGLPEHLDAQHVRDDVLRLAVEVRVNQRDVVVRRDDVPQRRQALLHALDHHGVRQRVAQVHELLVRRRARHEQPLGVAGHHAAHEAAVRDGAAHHGDVLGELGLEGAVEVLRAARGHERVAVRQLAEHADLIRVLELRAQRHGCLSSRRPRRLGLSRVSRASRDDYVTRALSLLAAAPAFFAAAPAAAVDR
mmetsp:Transcript_5104/g.14468  ORF Transcript_5104/g.14468 Transcript_5104/m.14468 type:complete len:325 (-) Transcript_5104:29-1003(-)